MFYLGPLDRIKVWGSFGGVGRHAPGENWDCAGEAC